MVISQPLTLYVWIPNNKPNNNNNKPKNKWKIEGWNPITLLAKGAYYIQIDINNVKKDQ